MNRKRVETEERFVNQMLEHATKMWSGKEGVAEKVQRSTVSEGKPGKKRFKESVRSSSCTIRLITTENNLMVARQEGGGGRAGRGKGSGR